MEANETRSRRRDELDVVLVGRGSWSEARLIVNGEDLIDVVGRFERPFASADGTPELAGSYEGLASRWISAPSMHLLGSPIDGLSEGSKPFLLGCVCGEPGCWPLLATVELADTTVTWCEFEHGFRSPEWSYDALGPFTFARTQYEAALGFGAAA